MGLRSLARPAGLGLLLLVGAGLLGASALGFPHQWLASAGLVVSQADNPWQHQWQERLAALDRQEDHLLEREAALQARELSLAQREQQLQAREVEWVRSLHDLAAAPREEGFKQVAGTLEKLPPPRAAQRLALLDTESAARVYLWLSEEQAAAILGYLAPEQAAAIMTYIGKGGAST